MKNYYANKLISLLIGLVPIHDASAYNSQALSSTLRASPHFNDLYLTEKIKLKGGLRTWAIRNQDSNTWELQHNKTKQSIHLLKTDFKLSDLTQGSQVLLKEFGILGLEILNSSWVHRDSNRSALRLELRRSSTQQTLIHYLFEIPRAPQTNLYALSCSNDLDQDCKDLVKLAQ